MDDDIIMKQEDSGIYIIHIYIHQAILYLSLLIY